MVVAVVMMLMMMMMVVMVMMMIMVACSPMQVFMDLVVALQPAVPLASPTLLSDIKLEAVAPIAASVASAFSAAHLLLYKVQICICASQT